MMTFQFQLAILNLKIDLGWIQKLFNNISVELKSDAEYSSGKAHNILDCDVIIIGSGPVGLFSATRLGRMGLKVYVLEKLPYPIHQGSKALCVQSDVLDLLDTVDCADFIQTHGCPWRTSKTYIGKKVIRDNTFPSNISGFSPFVNIPQWQIEDKLRLSAEETGFVQIFWDYNFSALLHKDKHVEVLAKTPKGDKSLKAKYILGCDGAGSSVRKSLGVPVEGKVHPEAFLIVDVKFEVNWRKERIFIFDAPSNPGRQIVIHPQPNNKWRIDWQLPVNCTPETEAKPENVSKRIQALIGEQIPFEIEWVSTYNFHHRYVKNLKEKRAFLLGDAAHSFPPFGARGMNSGLQDADNLAWKIAAVIKHRANEEILNSYHEERIQAALENLEITGKTINFMIPANFYERWKRKILFFGCRYSSFLTQYINSGKMSQPTKYDIKSNRFFKNAQTTKKELLGSVACNISIDRKRLRKIAPDKIKLLTTSKNISSRLSDKAKLYDIIEVIQVTTKEIAQICSTNELLFNAIAIRPDGYIAGITCGQPEELFDQLVSGYKLT